MVTHRIKNTLVNIFYNKGGGKINAFYYICKKSNCDTLSIISIVYMCHPVTTKQLKNENKNYITCLCIILY